MFHLPNKAHHRTFEEKLQTQIQITSRYKSASGRQYEQRHLIDLSELNGVRRIGEPPLLKIAKHRKNTKRHAQTACWLSEAER